MLLKINKIKLNITGCGFAKGFAFRKGGVPGSPVGLSGLRKAAARSGKAEGQALAGRDFPER